ncbi:hypothetical protein GH714_000259 [Hevea brasiliensis]|uniref:Retroviral polymerase SH3-like domain-containing protein n=1 Tax=Hevea brasiliensis TaxID=3981 RepID=A0A6A6NBA2_HEVBR|nr:hypothetical protein GH714_000259 [Hevea brasiliensis]
MECPVDTTKAFLEDFEKRFAKNEKAETSTILAKLISMRYTGKGNIREYIMEMSDLASKLKALKLDLSEDLLVHLVLITLPAQFIPKHIWRIDSGATTQISVSMQGCLNYQKPNDGERYIYVGDGKPNEKKLDSKTISRYFIGYLKVQGYKFYDPMTKSIFETGNARFFEDVEFAGGERLKDFVFEEEYVDIPLIGMDNDQEQFHIPDIV